MKIETKFSPGEVIYKLRKYYFGGSTKPCTTCGGHGQMYPLGGLFKGLPVTCPKCNGSKKITQRAKRGTWKVDEFGQIWKIVTTTYSDGRSIVRYHVNQLFGSVIVDGGDDYFNDKKLADAECKARNKRTK